MEDRSADSAGVSTFVIAVVLFTAVGGTAFLIWRRTAPLSRHVRNRRREKQSQGDSDPQRNRGMKPL